jgi:hypothetical protein
VIDTGPTPVPGDAPCVENVPLAEKDPPAVARKTWTDRERRARAEHAVAGVGVQAQLAVLPGDRRVAHRDEVGESITRDVREHAVDGIAIGELQPIREDLGVRAKRTDGRENGTQQHSKNSLHDCLLGHHRLHARTGCPSRPRIAASTQCAAALSLSQR